MITKKLGDICTIASGGTPLRSKEEYWKKGNIPWIKIGDIHSKHVCKAEECITADGLEHSSAKMLPKGTILYTIFATLGEVGILDIDACTNQAIAGITIKENQPMQRDYLYYFLKSKKGYVTRVGRGVAQNNINMSILREMPVPLPEERAQEKIVFVLDKINDITERRKTELATFDELVKARFVEMFGDPAFPGELYPIRKLGEVADIKSSHRVFTSEFVEEGIPFFRGTEIGALAFGQNPKIEYFITEEHYRQLAGDASKPQVGDLLMPSVCNKGQVWMVDTPRPFYYKDGRVLCISPDREIFDSRYLQFYMKMRTLIEYPRMGSGSTFAEFKIFQLKKLIVDIPPIEKQRNFADFAKRVEKSKAAIQRSLTETQTLFDSLMQTYFG